MFSKTIATVALCAAAVTAQIPPAPMEVVWEGMYPPPYLRNPEIALALDCVAKNKCYIAGGSNGEGFGVFEYDGAMNGQVTGPMMMPNMSMMVMDITVGGTAADPKGAFDSIDMLGESKALQYLAPSGTEWLPSAMPKELIWVSQSISGNADESTVVAVGTGPFVGNDLMVSKDAGKTFTAMPINFKAPENCSAPGYLVTPTPDAWFMTYSSEPPQNNSNSNVDAKYLQPGEHIIKRKLNGQALVIASKITGEVRTHYKSIAQWRQDQKQVELDFPKCSYMGYVLKSTDQGKSWTNLYTNPTMQPGEITCASATNCVVSLMNSEGSSVLVTTDGATFKVTYSTPAPTQQSAESIQAFAYATPTELWAGGSVEVGRSGKAMFWKSMDAGMTWTQYPHEIADIMGIMAMDFADGVGFALGMTMFKTTQIMRYKLQADYGTFTQKNCLNKGCTFLCQANVFPQGMCLNVEGGSAKAFCTPEGIKQYIYQTTSCVDGYKTVMQPINKCLNGTQGRFFENLCPTKDSTPHTGELADASLFNLF